MTKASENPSAADNQQETDISLIENALVDLNRDVQNSPHPTRSSSIPGRLDILIRELQALQLLDKEDPRCHRVQARLERHGDLLSKIRAIQKKRMEIRRLLEDVEFGIFGGF